MQPDCEKYRALFGPYIQDQVGTDTRRELARHLAACPECASAFGNEWRANLGESVSDRSGNGGAGAGRPRRGMRLHWIMLIIVTGAFLYMRFTATGQSSAPDEAEQAYREERALFRRLMASQVRLNEALVALRREYPTLNGMGDRAADKFAVYGLLERVRKALGRIEADPVAAQAALRQCLHPDFILEFSPQGEDGRRLGLDEALAEPRDLRGLVWELQSFRWWDWTENKLTLWAMGTPGRGPVLLILNRQGEGATARWQVLYINYPDKRS